MSQGLTRIQIKCQSCGKYFAAIPAEVKRGRAKWCSRACYYDRQNTSIPKRFWAKVRKTNSCWIWTGASYSAGYGIIGTTGLNGGRMVTHRLSWLIHYGEIPKGMMVLHKCDNPPCVNPEHLFLGTIQDNVDDMIKKGRHRFLGNAKISPEEVRVIRAEYADGKATMAELAKRYHLGPTAVLNIIHRTRWKDI